MTYLRKVLMAAGLLLTSMTVLAASLADTLANKLPAPLPVVASFSILGDVVSRVGGERITVDTLVGPDQDAHVYEPTADDLRKVKQAKLFFINGLGFEGWLERVPNAADYKGAVVVASQGVKGREVRDAQGRLRPYLDPHAWQNPANVIIYTNNIVAGLSKLDPAGAAQYRSNGDAYITQLKQLDTWASKEFKKVSAVKRTVLTTHDAFQYFGLHYGIGFVAAQGVSTGSEPSAKDVGALIRQIKRTEIHAVFIENLSNPKLIQQIAREAGVTVGGTLYSDALSGPHDPAPDYLTMMRYNIEQILKGLSKN